VLDLDDESDKPYECAPWLDRKDSKIVLRTQSRFQGWQAYQDGIGYLGGEAYWTATIEYALAEMGFEVVYAKASQFDDIKLAQEAHRIIVDGAFLFDNFTEELLDNPDIMCKLRHTEWWQLPSGSDLLHQRLARYHAPYDPKRGIKPFSYANFDQPDELGFVPFFVQSEVTLPPLTEITPPLGTKSALLMDKECRFSSDLILSLLNEGFELHLTCIWGDALKKLEKLIGRELMSKLILHPTMKPKEFASMIRHDVTVVIGFGMPLSSPTPYEALANGAAFLHPITVENKKLKATRVCNTTTSIDVDCLIKKHDGVAQHPHLMRLGEPYVYNYLKVQGNPKVTDDNILQAAKKAISNRFTHYIPPEHSLANVKRNVCENIIEQDRPCLCSENPATPIDCPRWFPEDDFVLKF